MADIRTLQFIGYAYGDSPVLLNAHIGGNLVFSGEVPTTPIPLPVIPDGTGLPGNQVLFAVTDPTITTNFSGSLPMTITVANGYGTRVGNVLSNFMPTTGSGFIHVAFANLSNASIDGTTLTLESVESGTILPGMIVTEVGFNPGDILPGTAIVSGSGLTWTVDKSQTVPTMTMQATLWAPAHGNATTFSEAYVLGNPTNSEGTPDPRSSVQLDDVTQVPPLPPSTGTWTWTIPPGSTLSYNLNLSLGNQDTPPPEAPAPV